QKFVTIKGSTDEIDYSPQPSIQKLENFGESTDEIEFSPAHPSIQKFKNLPTELVIPLRNAIIVVDTLRQNVRIYVTSSAIDILFVI
ncbi:9299_t:CDS:1, partial [Funneliformis mosseae]